MVGYNDFKHCKKFCVSIREWCGQLFGARSKYFFSVIDLLSYCFTPFKGYKKAVIPYRTEVGFNSSVVSTEKMAIRSSFSEKERRAAA